MNMDTFMLELIFKIESLQKESRFHTFMGKLWVKGSDFIGEMAIPRQTASRLFLL